MGNPAVQSHLASNGNQIFPDELLLQNRTVAAVLPKGFVYIFLPRGMYLDNLGGLSRGTRPTLNKIIYSNVMYYQHESKRIYT